MTSGKRTLVSGYLVSWEASAAFPLAQIRASLGQAGELATETQVDMPLSRLLHFFHREGMCITCHTRGRDVTLP